MEQLEYQEGRTEISHMGKVPLIERLTADFEPRNAGTVKGVGDDCAVIGQGPSFWAVNSAMRCVYIAIPTLKASTQVTIWD